VVWGDFWERRGLAFCIVELRKRAGEGKRVIKIRSNLVVFKIMWSCNRKEGMHHFIQKH